MNKSSTHDLISNYVSGDSQFEDNYQTHQQQLRDEAITVLLESYVNAYRTKFRLQKKYRSVLLFLCSFIIVAFSIEFLTLVPHFLFSSNELNVKEFVGLLSVLVTFLGSILGLVRIIAQYCFPKNDEEYITKIVGQIQNNDLSHKIENMKVFRNSMSMPTDKQ